jgi:hypothetical protein
MRHDDTTTDEPTDRPRLTQGLAKELWEADDPGEALDRWRDRRAGE